MKKLPIALLLAVSTTVSVGAAFAASPETMRANNGQIISPGTTKNQVVQWQGEPEMKDTNEYRNAETWYYTRDGGTYLIYFSGAQVIEIKFLR
ncbi:MAG: hypothetical protein PHF20_07530 [Halothiobacillaceae bacterium]|nr:hypothetical protein [Halothiobacillaceae bacterium]